MFVQNHASFDNLIKINITVFYLFINDRYYSTKMLKIYQSLYIFF